MPRGQHAFFTHEVLRDSALADPLFFLWAAHRDDAVARFTNIWRRCAEAGEPVEPIEPDGFAVEVRGEGPLYLALFTLPLPEQPIECFHVAVLVVVPEALLEDAEQQAPDVPAKDRLERALKIIVGSTTPEVRAGWPVPVRYFTLEKGQNLDGSDRTVLCEWERHETGPRHENFGDGPAPDPEAFLAAVTGLVLESRGGDA